MFHGIPSFSTSGDCSGAPFGSGSADPQGPETGTSKGLRADVNNTADTARELLEHIIRVEKHFHQQKKLYLSYIKEMDSRAVFNRDARISDLKTALAKERVRNEKLAQAFGRLQERYRLLLSNSQKTQPPE